MREAPLKVALHGMDERARQLFAMFVDGPGRGCCQITDAGQPEAVVVDLDGVGADRLWLDVRRRFHGPALVLSIHPRELHNAIWVPKPLKGEDFIAAIARARTLSQAEARPTVTHVASPTPAPRVSAPTAPPPPAEAGGISRAADLALQDNRVQECCGHMEDAVYRDPAQRARLFYRPDDYLQGWLTQAIALAAKEQHPVLIDGLGHPLYVSRDRLALVTSMREQYLRPLCVRTTEDQPISVRTVRHETLPPEDETDPRLRRLDATLWKIALWTARGRVPEGTPLDALVSLRAWPNLPRLMTVPHSMRIAALWVRGPTGLMATAPLLGIEQRYVFAFFSACHALGLVQWQQAKGHAPVASAAVPTQEKRGLFRRLLDKLSLNH